MHRNAETVSIEFGGSGSQPDVGTNQPIDPVLLLNAPVSGEPPNDLTVDTLDSTFGDGSYLHEGKYFGSKKELKKKLTKIAIKGNFEFQTRKSNISLWVIECVDPNCG